MGIGAAALFCEYQIKNGHFLVFTGGAKINIFATTPGDNPIGITMIDYSA